MGTALAEIQEPASSLRGAHRRMRVAGAGIATPVKPLVKTGSPRRTAELESSDWLRSLRGAGEEHDAAVAELHALLLRAARFEVARRRPTLPHLRGNELDDIAHEAANDALMSVLDRLDDFRGESRFTTWAYKFALLEAAVKLRKRAWQGREVPLEPESWALFSSAGFQPGQEVEQSELLSTIQQAIEDVLTPHQRQVLVALALNGVPIDVLADRLATTRGALYKTLHDARRKLRAHLADTGLSLETWLEESH
jgi:RNA polymerase sigma-70 factor, ECF subfamily